MDMQPDITRFESMFSGPFPFTSDGVVIGRPSASFEEEMQTMITFAGGEIDTDTLYHENMHQWWGDHVTEHGYTMTFYKEGLATLAEFLFAARKAQGQAGPGTRPAGAPSSAAWIPRSPASTPARTASGPWPRPTRRHGDCSAAPPPTTVRASRTSRCGRSSGTRTSPGRWSRSSVSTGGLDHRGPAGGGLRPRLPTRSSACRQQLGHFFTEWFDTAYPHGGGAARPHITGPGLAGPGFYTGSCTRS